jgi:SOS-response transcriptional repressor LexA
MVEAGILDGDIVIVSPATPVGPGDIAVVRFDRSTTTVKKVYVEGDTIILQSANSHYKPIVKAYPAEAEILGKVILVRRRLF